MYQAVHAHSLSPDNTPESTADWYRISSFVTSQICHDKSHQVKMRVCLYNRDYNQRVS